MSLSSFKLRPVPPTFSQIYGPIVSALISILGSKPRPQIGLASLCRRTTAARATAASRAAARTATEPTATEPTATEPTAAEPTAARTVANIR
jgi:hypothetical protein